MTTQSIFRRLFWKEYRLQRALWIAMIVLTVMLQLLFFWFFLPRDRPLFIFWTAAGLPALYLLGCGATLFAGEHESGVFEFQRSLPVGARIVFCAKASFAAISAIVMYGLMALLAFALTGWTLHPPQGFSPLAVLIILVFFGVELFLWAMLFSLTTRRVLPAAILGIAAASIALHVMSNLVSPNALTYGYWLAMPYRAAVAALLALVDFWLATRWFRERHEHKKTSRSALAWFWHGIFPRKKGILDRFSEPSRIAMLARLVWQHWRQSWRLIALVCAVTVVLAPITAVTLLAPITAKTLSGPSHDDWVLELAFTLIFIALFGICAFSPDQNGRSFRFLTDRGVPPKTIWLSRQLVMLLPIILLLPLLLYAACCCTPREWSPLTQQDNPQYATAILYVFGYVVLGVALGQMMSMFLRSGLLAGVFSVLLMLPLAGWWGLMLFWDVNWLWSVLPIPAAMFLATRLHTRNWLLERNTFRAWLPPILTLAIPLLAIAVAVPLHRIYEIPSVKLDRDLLVKDFERPATAEEQATMRLYEQAWQHYMTDPVPKGEKNLLPNNLVPRWPDGSTYIKANWLDAEHEMIALGLKASRGKIFNPKGTMSNPIWVFTLAELLTDNATKLESEGKLDEALENYLAAIRISKQYRDWCEIWVRNPNYIADALEREVYARLPIWASRPKQTKQRILAARDQLEKLTSHISLDHAIRHQYFILRHITDGDLTVMSAMNDGKKPPLPMPVQLWMSLPWERERALRLLDKDTYGELRGMHGARRTPELAYILFAFSELQPISIASTWKRGETLSNNSKTLMGDLKAMQTARAAVRLILTLKAWKLEHGSLPKTLDELVGPYLKELPIDPYSYEPFRYFRNGIESPLYWGQPWMPGWPQQSAQSGQTLAANTPFIWSTGDEVYVNSYTTDNGLLEKYNIWIRNPYEESRFRSSRPAKSEHEIWESGWPFPIP